MADIKISQLGEALAVTDNDVLPMTASGVTNKVKASTMKDYMIGNTNISGLGDGTPTGAIDALDDEIDANYAEWKTQWKKNGAYNLLPCPYSETSQVRDGTTFVVASNGKITVSGVPSNPPDFSYLRLVSVADSMAFASTYAGTSVKFCLCSSSATGLSLKVEGLDASNNTVFTQTGIQEGTVINIPSSVVKWEVLLVVANTFSGASTIVTPMFTTDLNATYADYVPYAKTNRELTTDKYLDNSSSYTTLDTAITTTFTTTADGLYLIAAKCNNATSTADVYLQNGSSPILSVLGVDVIASQLVNLKAGTTLYVRSDKGTYVVRGYYKA